LFISSISTNTHDRQQSNFNTLKLWR